MVRTALEYLLILTCIALFDHVTAQQSLTNKQLPTETATIRPYRTPLEECRLKYPDTVNANTSRNCAIKCEYGNGSEIHIARSDGTECGVKRVCQDGNCQEVVVIIKGALAICSETMKLRDGESQSITKCLTVLVDSDATISERIKECKTCVKQAEPKLDNKKVEQLFGCLESKVPYKYGKGSFA
uniref:Secreted protein n=1 Tax=Plectus sambesii TaxID=2011161 RepID=A0A914VYS2_9BILA